MQPAIHAMLRLRQQTLCSRLVVNAYMKIANASDGGRTGSSLTLTNVQSAMLHPTMLRHGMGRPIPSAKIHKLCAVANPATPTMNVISPIRALSVTRHVSPIIVATSPAHASQRMPWERAPSSCLLSLVASHAPVRNNRAIVPNIFCPRSARAKYTHADRMQTSQISFFVRGVIFACNGNVV